MRPDEHAASVGVVWPGLGCHKAAGQRPVGARRAAA